MSTQEQERGSASELTQLLGMPHSYKRGNNPAGENARYYCNFCGLELYGDQVGYVAAGAIYANGEPPPCPQCGEENSVDRDDT